MSTWRHYLYLLVALSAVAALASFTSALLEHDSLLFWLASTTALATSGVGVGVALAAAVLSIRGKI